MTGHWWILVLVVVISLIRAQITDYEPPLPSSTATITLALIAGPYTHHIIIKSFKSNHDLMFSDGINITFIKRFKAHIQQYMQCKCHCRRGRIKQCMM